MLKNPSALKAIARAEAEVISAEFKLQLKSAAQPAESDKLYRVQVGAFSSRKNAEEFLSDVKEKGLDGFVVEVQK